LHPEMPISLSTLTNPELRTEFLKTYIDLAHNIHSLNYAELPHIEKSNIDGLHQEALKRLRAINDLSNGTLDREVAAQLSKHADNINDINHVFELLKANDGTDPSRTLREDQIKAALTLLATNFEHPRLPIAFDKVLSPDALPRAVEVYTQLINQY